MAARKDTIRSILLKAGLEASKETIRHLKDQQNSFSGFDNRNEARITQNLFKSIRGRRRNGAGSGSGPRGGGSR